MPELSRRNSILLFIVNVTIMLFYNAIYKRQEEIKQMTMGATCVDAGGAHCHYMKAGWISVTVCGEGRFLGVKEQAP